LTYTVSSSNTAVVEYPVDEVLPLLQTYSGYETNVALGAVKVHEFYIAVVNEYDTVEYSPKITVDVGYDCLDDQL
jgi:hypothetical protein